MKLAVVIPTLDERDRIKQSVESALAPGVDVVVADGGSRDGTVEVAVRAGARVVAAPRGRARQLAIGTRAAQGEAIVLLHADTLLPEAWADGVRDALADPAVAGGCFVLRFDRRTPALRVIEWGAWLRSALFALPYGDQALFVRRQVLERIGGIPEAAIMEDLDLVRALRRCGRLVRLPMPAITSARRYEARGVFSTMLRNWGALLAWRLGLPRERVARWYGS
ncbi:MAG: TIGR04283 family arsenosugar biosynthesis glycosyltransferase [Myxococcota bacterium]